ncbi:MAG: dephospho-CoA kinase [Clostridia bacterium]|nr:dephospho-CoA kinase [Clostridia bacterium]
MTGHSPVIVGITGPSGSGKSLLRTFLDEKGFPCIDADGVYHHLLIPPSPCLTHLRQAFGDGIFLEDGRPDMPALRKLVFGDPSKLELLNQTVLGDVLAEIRRQISTPERQAAQAIFVDAPTLIESGFHKECHCVISVLAPVSLRMQRIIQRDGLTEEAAAERIRAQKDDAFYVAHSDVTLHNLGEPKQFLEEAEALLPRLLSFRKELS